jgi:UDP-N-acetylglucosamine:LPS N-acetylglucosamine transferase
VKKKIVIITSDGGGGQASIAQALTESLGATYTIINRCAFTDILKNIDPLQKITFGYCSGEDMYNTISTYKSLWGIHQFIYRLGTWYYKIFFKLIERRFTDFFTEEKVDGAISIIPIINQPILAACEKVQIPFLIYSPDINPEMYLEYLNNIHPTVPCALAVPAYHPHVDALAHKKRLPFGFVHEVGFPLRSAFLTTKDPILLKKRYGVPLDKPVILALLGSLGSPNLSTIAEYLSQIKHPAHLILCTGRYETVKKTLNKMTFPDI